MHEMTILRGAGIAVTAFLAVNAAADCRELQVGVRSVGPGGGGWIECVQPSRHARERLFVGCDVGGFYVSEDGGRSYRIRNAGLDQPFVETIAENPKDENLLLLGGRSGVYRSTDRGEHWQWMTNGFAKADKWGHANPVTAVVWDELDPRHAWAATGCPRSGVGLLKGCRAGTVYETRDAGLTWRETVAAGDALTERPAPVVSFSPDPSDPKKLLVTNPHGLWRSSDGGAHWTLANEGLPVGEGYNLRRIARCAARPQTVYLTVRQRKGLSLPLKGGLYRSTDGGLSWSACACRGPKVGSRDGAFDFQHWCDATVAVDPRDPDVVWVAGVTWWKDGVWKSTDGGRTFEPRTPPKREGWIDFWGFAVSSLGLSAAAPDSVVFGTSGVVYRSDDGGATWDQRYTAKRDDGKISGIGLEVLCLRKIVPDRFVRNRHYLGFWDIGLLVTEDGGRSLTRNMTGVPRGFSNSCFALVQSPAEPQRLFATFGNWGFSSQEARASCVFATSADAGASWQAVTNAVGWPGGPMPHLALVNGRPPYVLAGAATEGHPSRRGFVLSRDGGATWERSAALAEDRDVSAFAADDGALYVGTTITTNHLGHLFRSTDQGRTWTQLFPPNVNVGTPVAVAARGPVIAVAASQNGNKRFFGLGGLFLSRDGGRTWARAIDTYRCSDVAFGSEARTIVAGATPCAWRDPGFGRNEGVWLTRDGGANWSRLVGPGFDRPDASHLAVNPFDDREIWVGTGGDSVFVLTVP